MPETGWVIVTGEYPPQSGGVADYSRLVAEGLAARGARVDVIAPECSAPDAAAPVTIHRLGGDFAGMERVLDSIAGPRRLLVQYTPYAFGRRGMNLPFCWRLWRRARMDEIWTMFHEVAFPMKWGQPVRRNVLGAAHRAMAALLSRASRRSFVSTRAWLPMLARPAEWLPVPSMLPETARRTENIVGHFGTYGPYTSADLAGILGSILEAAPGYRVLLAGAGSDRFRDSLDRGIRHRVDATGTLPAAELAGRLAACRLLVQPYADGVTTRRTTAMAGLRLGVPVLTQAGPLSEDLWAESRAVALAESSRMAEAATRLLGDPRELEELGLRGQRLYEERFSLDRTLDVLLPAREKLRVMELGKFYPPHHGGMESHLEALSRDLAPRVDLEVVVANDENRTVRESTAGFDLARLATAVNVASAPLCPSMAGELRRTRARVVHLHWPNPGAVLAYLASGTDARLIVTYHSDVVRQRAMGTAFQPLLDLALSRAFAIIVTSPNLVEHSPTLRRFRDKCRVIPFGIAAEEFDGGYADQADRIRARYSNDIVLSVGRLVYYKGFEYLIRAMEHSPRGHAVIIGSGPLEAPLRELASRLGVEHRVALLGSVPDVRPYYRAAKLFVLPSVAPSEAFGIVQLEAMASGLPVINTDLPSGVPFVSLHGETGFTVPPESAEALGEAIALLLENDALRETMGRRARQRVEKVFRHSDMVESTLRVYEEAAR